MYRADHLMLLQYNTIVNILNYEYKFTVKRPLN